MSFRVPSRWMLLTIFIFSPWLSACQTPAHRSFENVRPGMDKSIVVETVGSPTKSRRWNGKDRWTYEFRTDPGGIEIREVHFLSGKVVYAGPALKPDVSADEQDRLNALADEEDARQWEADQEERDRNLGTSRLSKTRSKKSTKLDADDLKLRESLYGLPSDSTIEQKKRPPVYEPID